MNCTSRTLESCTVSVCSISISNINNNHSPSYISPRQLCQATPNLVHAWIFTICTVVCHYSFLLFLIIFSYKLHLELMASLSPECTPLKHEYDTCFNQWYAQLLLSTDSSSSSSLSSLSNYKKPSSSTTSTTPFVPCEALFKKYQECVWVNFKSKPL